MNKSKESLMVVDANNRAYAAYHSYSRLSYKGQGVSVIYGLPSMIKSLIFQEKPAKVIMVWDGKKSPHRIKLNPNYKVHREAAKVKYNFDQEDFLIQKRYVQKIFYYLGVPQILNPNAEADDLIYRIVKSAKKVWGNVTIVSGDKDFHQLLDGRKVTIWNDAKKNEISEANLQDYYPYKAHQTVDYLTLVGDDSDDIKGYPGIGPKKAMDLLNKYDSLENFLDSGDRFLSIDRTKLLEIKLRNHALIDLSYFYRKYKDELKVMYIRKKDPAIQKKKFLALAAKFNMQRLLNSGFMEEFIDLKLRQD